MRRMTLVLGIALLAATPAQAQFSMFTSRTAFNGAAGPLQTERFDAPFTLVPITGATYAIAGGTVTFDANLGGIMFGGGDFFADLLAGGMMSPQFVRFDFTSPVTSFGADFSSFDLPGITLGAMIGATSFSFGEGFFGIVSTTPFSSLSLRDPSDDTFFAVDNLSVSVPVSTVPEPATVSMMLAGVVLLAAHTLRRRSGSPSATSAGAVS